MMKKFFPSVDLRPKNLFTVSAQRWCYGGNLAVSKDSGLSYVESTLGSNHSFTIINQRLGIF